MGGLRDWQASSNRSARWNEATGKDCEPFRWAFAGLATDPETLIYPSLRLNGEELRNTSIYEEIGTT
jgi:hypothetical protein